MCIRDSGHGVLKSDLCALLSTLGFQISFGEKWAVLKTLIDRALLLCEQHFLGDELMDLDADMQDTRSPKSEELWDRGHLTGQLVLRNKHKQRRLFSHTGL